MKKVFGVLFVILMLAGISQITPALTMNSVDKSDLEYPELKWKFIIAIGRIDICFQEKVIDGFVLFGYTAGEIITLEEIYIEFELFPILLSNGLFFTSCFYKEA